MRAFVSLRRQAEFERLRRRGRRASAEAFTLFRAEPWRNDRRSVLGITVSKAVGIAATRNLVRRRLAAIAHEALRGLPPTRLLLIVRPLAANLSYAALQEQFTRALTTSHPS